MIRRAALLLMLMVLGTGAARAAEKPRFHWDRYFAQDEVDTTLRQLHDAYPQLTELSSLGRTAEGRDIWCLTIANPRTGAAATKPAMYVDGAIHGNEIQATEVCLYTAWLLLDRYGEWDRITELVDRAAFYVVPTVNVDSRARFFTDPGSYNIGRTARVPYDDDYDGRLDEDAPEDLDGDGMILQMRIRDPHGEYRTHPDDPRVMVRVKPGEPRQWTRLGLEGLDNDGDGLVNEDGPGYLDLNRNWGAGWQPPYAQDGAGDFPLSAPNTRAIGAFIAAHPNIGFAFTFHNYGGMFLRGPSNERSPAYAPQDVAVWDWLGLEGERTVPGYRYLISSVGLYATAGDFDEFMYATWGVLAFTGELTMSAEAAYRGRSDAPDSSVWSRRPGFVERQQFNDHLMAGEMFRDWQPFAHPQYGQVEIGGWKTFTTRLTPGWMLPEMLHRNAMFVIWTATQLPRVTVEVVAVDDLGGGLRRVRARAANAGGLPSLTAHARLREIYRPDLFTIAGDGVTVVGGGLLTDPHLGVLAPAERRPARLETYLDGFAAREAAWIVSGKGEVTVRYEGVKCGAAEARVRLP